MQEWELVEERRTAFNTVQGSTYRLKVPSGWLYRVTEETGEQEDSFAVVFVPEIHKE